MVGVLKLFGTGGAIVSQQKVKHLDLSNFDVALWDNNNSFPGIE